MKRILFLLALLFFTYPIFAQSNIITGGDFIPVYNKAKSENKKLFVYLDCGLDEDKTYTPQEINYIKRSLAAKYKDDYIFHRCYTSNKNNTFLFYTVFTTVYPTVCVFDEKGTLVYVAHNLDDKTSDYMKRIFESVENGVKFYPPKPEFKTTDNKKILEMLDYTIKANIKYASGKGGLTEINKAIFIEETFYNSYLKYKIILKQGNKSAANIVKEKAISHCRPGAMLAIYKPLIYDLNGIKMK